MKKEQLSTSTKEVPKVKLALEEKYKEQDKKEKKNKQTYLKKNLLNYLNLLDGDF